MNNQTKIRAALLSALLAIVSACGGSNQNQPVTTTTNTNGAANTTTAPPAGQVEDRDNVLARVVHAIPGAGAVDVFAENNKAFTNVAYKSVTPYREIPDDRQTFRVRPTGQDTATPLVEDAEGFSDGQHYTIIALPTDDGRADLRFVRDNITAPSSGKAKVRVIHAAAGVGEVDVYARGNNDALFDGVNFPSESSYNEIDPFTGTLEVRREGQNTAVLTIPNARFEAGKIYTIIVVGRATGTPRLEAVIVEDQLGAGGTSGNMNGNANMNRNMNANMTNGNMNRNMNR